MQEVLIYTVLELSCHIGLWGQEGAWDLDFISKKVESPAS